VEPVEGWQTWSEGILDMIKACESSQALDRVRTRHGGSLVALKRERPDLYATIGEGFAQRGQDLIKPKLKPAARPRATQKTAAPQEAVDA